MRIIIKDAVIIADNKLVKVNIVIKDTLIDGITTDCCNDADAVYDAKGMLAVPGLINAHTHSYMSLFKGIGDDLSFSDWLFNCVMPLEDKLTSDDAYWCTLLSCIEMISSGTTCFNDMHMFSGSCAKAVLDSGMRAVLGRGLSDSDGREGGTRRIKEAFDEINSFSGEERITFCLAPHAIYTCSEEYLKSISSLAKEKNLPLHIHLSESKNEFDTCMQNHGLTPTEYLDKIGFFKAPVVAAHCVHLTDNDIQLLKKHNVTVITNPKSNLKLGNGIAPVSRLADEGIRICIGTDGSASNNSLNMFSEMNYTALLQKGVNYEPTSAPATEVFKYATQAAAEAFGLNTGIIECGKKADIVLINTASAGLVPLNNPLSALVYCENGSNVESVFISGKAIMLNKKLLTIDKNEVINKVEAIIKRIKN